MMEESERDVTLLKFIRNTFLEGEESVFGLILIHMIFVLECHYYRYK